MKKGNYKKGLTFLLVLSIGSVGFFCAKNVNKNSNSIVLKSGITNHIPHKLSLLYSPNDSYYSGESKVDRTDQKYVFESIADDMESVWDNYTGKGVTVAIIDTGLDLNHIDLGSGISDKSCSIYTAYNKYTYTYETICDVGIEHIGHDFNEEEKYMNHGSSVAGIIAGRNNNSATIGVAFDATLLIIKCDLDSISINEAIKYAADNGADIINMSFGGYASPYENTEELKTHDKIYDDYDPNDEYSMVNGLNYAHKKVIILIASTGNEATNTQIFTAANKHVISVGALDKIVNDDRASFSNYNAASYEKNGYNVDIAAPGYVVAPYPVNNSPTNDDVKLISGASFAAPLISGAAALWKEKYPNGTPYQFEQALFNSAYDIGRKGFDTLFGNGRVNISKLLNLDLVEDTTEEEIDIDFASTLELEIGKEYQLKVGYSPKGEYDITYTSASPRIATIDDSGKVKAVGYGKAYIEVKINNSSAICLVNVVKKTQNTSKQCGGEIVITSTILSSLALLGFILLKAKKKD